MWAYWRVCGAHLHGVCAAPGLEFTVRWSRRIQAHLYTVFHSSAMLVPLQPSWQAEEVNKDPCTQGIQAFSRMCVRDLLGAGCPWLGQCLPIIPALGRRGRRRPELRVKVTETEIGSRPWLGGTGTQRSLEAWVELGTAMDTLLLTSVLTCFCPL